MKLKNLLFGTMIALAFTACSSDNDPVIEPTPDPVGDTTTLQLFLDKVDTKAESDGITNLQVLVFDNQTEPVLEVVGGIHATNQYQSEEISVPTAGKKNVLVVANCPDKFAANMTLSDVFAITKAFDADAEVDGLLTMNSEYYEDVVVLELGKKHHLGFLTEIAGGVNFKVGEPVKLFRNVARVKLNSITIGATLAAGQQYPNPKFLMKQVYILHGNETTLVAGGKELWGATSYADTKFLNGGGDYMPSTEKSLFEGLVDAADYRAYTSYTKDYGISMTDGQFDFDGGDGNPEVCEFYVYERPITAETKIKTLLVVAGVFSYEILNPAYTDEDGDEPRIIRGEYNRYYTMAIGETGIKDGTYGLPADFYGIGTPRDLANGNSFSGVYRNMQYNINLTITGPGYSTDKGDKDNPYLDVLCEVAPWGVVTQNVEIE